MASLIRQLNSQTSYMADGSTTLWNFSFPYISASHVKAQYVQADGLVVSVGYTLIGPAQLSITPAVPDGAKLTIYRDTPKSAPLVDFIDRANLTEASLDLNAKQDIYAAAEAYDWAQVALLDGPIAYVPVAVTGNSLKNVLVNGTMAVGQRSPVALTGVGQNGETDRWIVGISGAAGLSAGTGVRTTPSTPTDWQYPRVCSLLGMTFTSGRPFWEQRLETTAVLPLADKPCVFSGQLKQFGPNPITFRIAIEGSAAPASYDTVINSTTVVVPPNTPTKFSLVAVIPTELTPYTRVLIIVDTAIAATALTIHLGDCQLELGSVPTSLEVRPIAQELAMCQRFYEQVTVTYVGGVGGAFNVATCSSFLVQKRTVPTIVRISAGTPIAAVNVGGAATYFPYLTGVTVQRTAVGAGQVAWSEVVSATAEI